MAELPNDPNNDSQDLLAVIVDQRSGREYYVAPIDNFELNGVKYAVMYNYVPSSELNRNELLVMRCYNEDGETYYGSVRGKEEAESVFARFFSRYSKYSYINEEL